MKRTLPNHEEGEIRVIGGILLHPEEIGMVSAVLEPEDFFSPFRRQLFETLILMNENSKVIDPTTLLEEFLLNSKIKREVALGYITKIQEETVTSAAFHYYAKKLKEMRQRREIMSAADKAIEHACRVQPGVSALG